MCACYRPSGLNQPGRAVVFGTVVGEITAPAVYDRDAAATQIIQCVMARWKAIRPKDYKAWLKYCDDYRKKMNRGGWSNETKDMKVTFLIHPYVQWTVARIVGDTSWNFREERLINAYLREVPCARMDGVVGTAGHSALNAADRTRQWGA